MQDSAINRVSRHASQRMEERKVSLKAVRNALERGKCTSNKRRCLKLEHGKTTVVVSKKDRTVVTTWKKTRERPKWRAPAKKAKKPKTPQMFSPLFNSLN